MDRPLDSTPSDEQKVELEVTRTLGLMALLHPELIDRVPHERLRAVARETMSDATRERIGVPPSVPKVFRDAFQ